jgi:4-alpha-glucanotransferase
LTGATRGHLGKLGELARLYGVETSYKDVRGRRQPANPESLVAVLRSLGATIETAADAADAIRDRKHYLYRRVVEPVIVAWDGKPSNLMICLPGATAESRIACELTLETGEKESWVADLKRASLARELRLEGERYAVRRIRLRRNLPLGFHRLDLDGPAGAHQVMIVASPRRAFQLKSTEAGRAWGVFLPLYALHSAHSWGIGDFSDLKKLLDWTEQNGGTAVATLPLLAAYLEQPYDPSPYTPASRLFWNELYLDITALPEFEHCQAARRLAASAQFRSELEQLRSSPLIDYRRIFGMKRSILEMLAARFFANPESRENAARAGSAPRKRQFEAYLREYPLAHDYARFRAALEKHGPDWRMWPQPRRNGELNSSDGDPDVARYHLYAQWNAHEQLKTISGGWRQKHPGICLDMPLGIHRAGFDVWRFRDAFVLDMSGGAPPDVVFTKGQNWDFPPLHPERIRQKHYEYYVACLRNQMRHSGLLRIDHVMGLHRLYWIPQGCEASAGLYVHYPAEELYAILCLEAHRHQALIVGENLGTVPPYVTPTMLKHGVKDMYVVQYELASGARLRPVPAHSVASLNTHDMPPFAAFWKGLDIEDRQNLGLIGRRAAERESMSRQALRRVLASFLRRKLKYQNRTADSTDSPEALLEICLKFLGSSAAALVQINLEDLWLETESQNVPGTSIERPNWRRRARYDLETFTRTPQVRQAVAMISEARSGRPAEGREKRIAKLTSPIPGVRQ